VLELDTRRGRYRRLIVRDGRVAGATLLDEREAAAIAELRAEAQPPV
jgi:NAD(P)H-nitrite reductase large subunit